MHLADVGRSAYGLRFECPLLIILRAPVYEALLVNRFATCRRWIGIQRLVTPLAARADRSLVPSCDATTRG